MWRIIGQRVGQRGGAAWPGGSLNDSQNGEATTTAWNAAMVCPLAPSPFEEYMAQVQEGQLSPGRPIWLVAFDLGL